jgi:hypothetical protein
MNTYGELERTGEKVTFQPISRYTLNLHGGSEGNHKKPASEWLVSDNDLNFLPYFFYVSPPS